MKTKTHALKRFRAARSKKKNPWALLHAYMTRRLAEHSKKKNPWALLHAYMTRRLAEHIDSGRFFVGD